MDSSFCSFLLSVPLSFHRYPILQILATLASPNSQLCLFNSAILLDLFEFPHLVPRSGNSSGKLGQSQGSFYLFPFFQGSLAVILIAQVLKKKSFVLASSFFWLRKEDISSPWYCLIVGSGDLKDSQHKMPGGSLILTGLHHCLINLQ